MSTHDLVVDNQTMPNVRADVNLALQALGAQQSGTADPATMYAYERQARTDLGVIRRRNAANGGWLLDGTLAETFVVDRSSNTILGLADYQRTFRATSSFTQTLTAVATLTDGWVCNYRVESGVTTVFDPNGAENIDGATTKSVVGPASGMIVSNGSAFYTIGFPNSTTLLSDATATLTKGYSATPYNAGTKSSGTYTPDEANGNFQYAVNGGAHTLAPPTNNCGLLIQYTNNASAGAITTSGFTKVSGDAFTTTNADDFLCDIRKINGFSHLHVTALQ